MLLLGITGGIGSGKTLVCQVLEKFGIPVYYADENARKLMNTDRELIIGVKGLLGAEAYRDGELDRKHVAGLVFNDPELLKRLNHLVHPVVRSDFRDWAGNQKDAPYVVKEAALLLESGSAEELDMIVVVDAPEELRVSRVASRDGISKDQVRSRMANQMSQEVKKGRADLLITNDEEQMLLPQIAAMHEHILNRK